MPVTLTRRRRIAAAIIATLLLAYTLGGFFGVPRLAERLAHSQVESLGHRLELGEVRFNPFSFEARVEALRLTEAGGEPLLAFDSLDVNLGLFASIWHRGAVLQSVRWTAPDVAVVIEPGGGLNLARLAPPAPEESAAPEEDSAPPRVRIGELQIERGRIGFEDRSREPVFRFELTPISFDLQDFSTQLDHRNAYEFHGSAATGEELDWRGEFTVQPLGASGEFALRNLQARTVADYLREQAPVRLASGAAELEGSYRLALDGTLSLDVDLPSIQVRDLALALSDATDAPRPVEVAQIGLHDLHFSLAQQRVALERIEIDGARVDARREQDGSIDLAQLYLAPAVPETPESAPVQDTAREPTDAPSPWRVHIDHLALRDGAVTLEDHGVTPAARVALAPITVNLRELSTEPGASFTLDADLAIDGSGRLRVEGEAGLDPMSAQLRLDLQDYALTALQPYLAATTGITLASGNAASQGELQLAIDADAAPAITFKGDAAVTELGVLDRADEQELLGWQALRATGIDFASAPQKLDIESIELQAPSARVEISEDRQLNVARALAAPDGASAAEPPPAGGDAAPPLPVRIGAIRVEQGRMRFTDRSIEPRFSAGIVDLHGELRDLALDGRSRAHIRLDGKVDDYAPVKIEGELVPSAFGTHTDIAMSFRNIDLIRFNPYSGRFAGYNIERGKLTTELRYQIRERRLEAEHHVVVDQLQFGEATGSKDAVPLPVKLAAALLKDRHGIIDLDLPVRGDLDDPSFRIGAVVWKALFNLLNKAVTSPFALLGALAGGGDELAYVDFAPGSADLSAEQSEKLQKLAAALIERPQLRLDIPLTQAEADAEALARAALEARMPTTDDERIDALEDLHREVLGRAPDYPESINALESDARPAARAAHLEPLLLDALAPDPQALVQLAVRRARAVQAAVLTDTGIEPERTFLTRREAASLNEQGQVRMDLALQ